MKIESETGVKSDTPFCLRLPIEKTNSGEHTLNTETNTQHPLRTYEEYCVKVKLMSPQKLLNL